MAVAGASYGLEEAKERIPDMPDLGPAQAAAGAVVGVLSAAAAEAAVLAEDLSLLIRAGLRSSGVLTDDGNNTDTDGGGSKANGNDEASTASAAGSFDVASLRAAVAEAQAETSDGAEGMTRSLKDIEALDSMMDELARLQTEVHKLEAENAMLRRSVILNGSKIRKGERRAVELFAEIMSLREQADKAFKAADHLPRVVVVGDQSAGKTSVLETIARARIFPRGAGEMMTRAPVQVTLSEHPQHTAQIGDQHYDLGNEKDLAKLRDEIERKMNKSVQPGESVSSSTISLNVRGPGLRPMILVDLPGLIQHHTMGMADDTKDKIRETCELHINNPNAIILCVQDATRDAEGSSVADVVRKADPNGKRTMFVLTKVDMAERLDTSAKKLERILKGQRFNMKARNYFAVVTGTNQENDSIHNIRKAERQFFDSSKLFMSGAFKPSTLGTDNLASAVSIAFWELVNSSVQEELKTTAGLLKKKETEFRDRFPQSQWMSREDLLSLGRHAILGNVAKVNGSLSAKELELMLTNKLWDEIQEHVMDNLYIEAGSAVPNDYHMFKAHTEELLDTWVSKDLPTVATNVAQTALLADFDEAINFPDPDELYGTCLVFVCVCECEKFGSGFQGLAL
jgi:optic atrophy protein 1